MTDKEKNQMDQLKDLLEKQEELHPDLKEYYEPHSHSFEVLRHPLLFAVPYTSMMNAYYNKRYEFIKKEVEQAIEEKNYGRVLGFYERPYRIQKFEELFDLISDDEKWEIFGWIWTDSENIWQCEHIIKRLLALDVDKSKMMDDDERAFLERLPDTVMVYRGHKRMNKMGYSWTLSPWHAHFFAKRLLLGDQKASVHTALCKKEDIIAVMLGRNEWEIVVDPKKLMRMRPLNPPKREGVFATAYKLAIEKFNLSGGHHGPTHWEQVERNVIHLCKYEKYADLTVTRLFAILHDCCREEEMDDPEHGKRAANFVKELFNQGKLSISNDQYGKLYSACALHNEGKTTRDPTIGVCWDADRLDLMRVGFEPNPLLLSTDTGKKSIWRVT